MIPIARGLEFPEGPIALNDGSVLLVEIRRGTLSRVTPDGGVYVCNNGGFEWTEHNGVGLSPDGSPLYVAETITGRIWSWQARRW